LRRLGISTLDLVVVTHPHADHIGQFDQVMSAVEVDEVWWSGATHTTLTFDRALAALEASDAAYEEPRAGDTTTVGSVRFDVVNPGDLSGDLHDSSLAFRVSYGDSSVLFTGDAEAHTEQRMAVHYTEWLDADVYQVGHHGSGSSTTPAFLATVSPQIAVYSAGAGNSFSHPHPEVLDRLESAGVRVFGADVHGTVTLTSSGDGTWSVSGEPVETNAEPQVSYRQELWTRFFESLIRRRTPRLLLALPLRVVPATFRR
jgi:competence protein ComEC